MLRRLRLSAILAALICTNAVVAAPQWTVVGNIPPKDFIIQSHRGAGELAPENTIEAFELAWKLGTVPEADLRTTRDGVIVAFHDADFSRVVKGAGPDLRKKGVADLTYPELAKLDVGGWKGEQFVGRRVSKLTEVYESMRNRPERRLYLDIKNVDLAQLAREVREHEVTKQVILASTKYDQIQRWKELAPEAHTLLWMGGAEAALKKRIADLRAVHFAGVTQLQIHVRLNTNSASAEPFLLSRDFLKETGAELRARGILYQGLPWGVSEPEVYWRMLDLGFASFATDHPEATAKAVKDYYRRPSR